MALSSTISTLTEYGKIRSGIPCANAGCRRTCRKECVASFPRLTPGCLLTKHLDEEGTYARRAV